MSKDAPAEARVASGLAMGISLPATAIKLSISINTARTLLSRAMARTGTNSQLELVRLHQEIDVTIMNVTHDQREALMLSDRIAVMNAGRIEQIGAGDELYTQPAAEFVAAQI